MINHQHLEESKINEIKENIPNDIVMMSMSDLFKVLGDPTRIRILYVLYDQEMCVCDIANSLEMSQSAISHQLRVLKQAQLVKYRRNKKEVIYALADTHVKTIFAQALEHVGE